MQSEIHKQLTPPYLSCRSLAKSKDADQGRLANLSKLYIGGNL